MSSSNITFLHARLDDRSLEARYGHEQARRLIRQQHEFAAEKEIVTGEVGIVRETETDLVLVLTDPLAVSSPNLVGSLIAIMNADRDLAAAVPTTNLTDDDRAFREPPEGLLTLGQMERAFPTPTTRFHRVSWKDADPGLFLARTDRLDAEAETIHRTLSGATIAVAEDAYIYRYAPQQSMPRLDLLELIPTDVGSVLEIGCGEGILGGRIRDRQDARVVGIEIDSRAASIARDRLDRVWASDASEALIEIDERFEWVVGGDVLEHLADPWEFLRQLKRVVTPDGKLLLSIPNVAVWPVIAELLRGRFDYAYAGHLSAGHLRFFTRRTIEETIEMGGWE
ncbi:MAG: class I SAM-dependent methyltransferase, partial [Thermoanaerobaculia bacterium]|nr:class I SAM-dependent methyltransferase [Thermoanaerobaculia bacterium]